MPSSTWPARPDSARSAFSAAMRKSRTICAAASRNAAVKFYLGDVRNYDSVLQAMRGVDFVFHAAALKQVPSCEFFPDRSGSDQHAGRGKRDESGACFQRRQGDCAEHGQSRISRERNGDVQGADGEMHGGQGADVRRQLHGLLRNAIWERDGISRVGDSAVSEPDSGRRSR